MEISYLSWLRNRVGKTSEKISPPETVRTLDELVGWLTKQEGNYQVLQSYRSVINASVNGQMAKDWADCRIAKGDRIQFFSPMAGG